MTATQQPMKKYKLLKDLPTDKSGTIYYLNGNSYYPCRKPDGTMFNLEDMKGMSIARHIVENNKDWFQEEVTEPSIVPERIEVTVSEMVTERNNLYGYSFNVNKINIDCGKIKQAIESVLNDTVVEDKPDFTLAQAIQKVTDNKDFHVLHDWVYKELVEKKYTQSEVDAMMEGFANFRAKEVLNSIGREPWSNLEDATKGSLYKFKATLPLQQVQEDKPFVWDDQLVAEFACDLRNNRKKYEKEHKSWRDSMGEFKDRVKQSKQSL